ncbi:MAG: hypothetical protein M3O50_04560, partial [Myxococcota bacterium]|nr:hypothetical protein [Myxococcota bacterium]
MVATLAAGALLASAPAGADDAGTREAKRRFEEGIARTQAGDWEAARLSFRQSLAASASQNALFNLALAEEKCARPLEALLHFKQYIEWPSLSQTDRTQAQRHIADLFVKTGHIDVRAPAGAVFSVDAAKDVGTAPLSDPLDVAPGHHVIVARMGAEAKTVDVNAVAGQVTRVAFQSEEPAPAAVRPPPAPVAIAEPPVAALPPKP